jgi:hypothetical protein
VGIKKESLGGAVEVRAKGVIVVVQDVGIMIGPPGLGEARFVN